MICLCAKNNIWLYCSQIYLFLSGMFRFQRQSGPIPSSMLGLEVYTGAIDDFGFEDYLNGNCPFTPIALHVSRCCIHFSRSVDSSLMVSQYAPAAIRWKIHTLILFWCSTEAEDCVHGVRIQYQFIWNKYFSFLADPRDSETVRPVDFHHGMEVRLGMSKGPVAPSFI